MATKIGINGFGRIGRCVARIASASDDIEIVPGLSGAPGTVSLRSVSNPNHYYALAANWWTYFVDVRPDDGTSTFADYATFAIAREAIGPNGGVTVSMTNDFTAAARAGDLLEADVDITRETRSMVFVQGRLRVEGRGE